MSDDSPFDPDPPPVSACCARCGCWFGIRPGMWGDLLCRDCHEAQGEVFQLDREEGDPR